MFNILFIGPPGGGKGTEIQLLQQQKYHKISTGDLLRNEITNETKLGKSIKRDMDNGKLISDEIVTKLLEKEIKQHKNGGIIFDGFPRTVKQAEKLDTLLKKNRLQLDVAINIDTSDKIITKRIVNRYSCKTCGATYNKYGVQPKKKGICDVCKGTTFFVRSDDTLEVVKKRLQEYRRNIVDLMNYYNKKNILYTVSGDSGDQYETHKQVKQVFKIVNEVNKLKQMQQS